MSRVKERGNYREIEHYKLYIYINREREREMEIETER